MSVREPEHVRRNRAAWNTWAKDYVAAGERAWASSEPTWGVFGVSEARLHVLPERLDGLHAIELGCGAGYVSAWMARRGARVVGIDPSEGQLATARRLQREHALSFPLLHGNAETVPFADASFDFAISEYGACLWAEPERWLPEAARLLRPSGRLVFLTNSLLLALCMPDVEGQPAGDRLLRSCAATRRMEVDDPPTVEFHRTPGEWIALLRANGLVLDALTEVYPPESATTGYPFVTLEWARRWPCEEIYFARKSA